MMERIFDMDNKFFTFMGKIADLILLNIIFLVCCIPVVTIGASVTALYYVTLKMVRNEESYIFRSFMKSFKLNFKQATVIWLILLAAGALLWFDFQIMGQAGSDGIMKFIYLGLCFILLIFGMVAAYIFPLLSRFDNTVKMTFKNSLLMALRHLPRTLLILIVTYVPMFLTLNYGVLLVYGTLVWLVIGFALTAFINAKTYTKIYQNYIPAEETEEEAGWKLPEET